MFQLVKTPCTWHIFANPEPLNPGQYFQLVQYPGELKVNLWSRLGLDYSTPPTPHKNTR